MELDIYLLSITQRGVLAKALLKCPCLQTSENRQYVLRQIDESIFNRIKYENHNMFDIFNILDTFNNYGGFSKFIEVIDLFEEGSDSFKYTESLFKLMEFQQRLVELLQNTPKDKQKECYTRISSDTNINYRYKESKLIDFIEKLVDYGQRRLNDSIIRLIKFAEGLAMQTPLSKNEIHKIREVIDDFAKNNNINENEIKRIRNDLAIEFERETLAEFVSKRGSPLEEVEALRYVLQISEDLICNNNLQALYPDIKPQNIKVDKATNKASLIKSESGATCTSSTSNFMAPEQLTTQTESKNYTVVYSLAATLYYLLTKEYPIDAEARKHGKNLKEPKKINGNISDRINKAILWGMELDYRERPHKVEEWLEFLNPKKVKFDAKVLIDSANELEKAIITHFCPHDLRTFLLILHERDIYYDNLVGEYLHEKVQNLISRLQKEYHVETFVEEMKNFKPEAFN